MDGIQYNGNHLKMEFNIYRIIDPSNIYYMERVELIHTRKRRDKILAYVRFIENKPIQKFPIYIDVDHIVPETSLVLDII